MKQRIMIVEDDRDIRETLAELLEDEGYEILTAGNGAEALDLLRGGAEPPSLILLDLMMPVMDGRSFRLEQRADPQLDRIPVVVLSAYHDAAAQAAELEVAAFLSKPLRPDTLMRLITEHARAA
jgi:CheY-like chemotaxis protein